MDYRIFILSRKEVIIVVISTLIGGVCQLVCLEYLKRHPELLDQISSKKLKKLKKVKKLKNKNPSLFKYFPRGGAIVEVIGAKIIINIGAATIAVIAEKGALIFGGSVLGFLCVRKIPSKAISEILRNAAPTYQSNYKNEIIKSEEELKQLECGNLFEYIRKMLTNKDIPFEQKKDACFRVLVGRPFPSTRSGQIAFVFCMTALLRLLFLNDIAGYLILIQNLIDALKSGKLPKRLVRMIIRYLLRSGVIVDPELIEAASE